MSDLLTRVRAKVSQVLVKKDGDLLIEKLDQLDKLMSPYGGWYDARLQPWTPRAAFAAIFARPVVAMDLLARGETWDDLRVQLRGGCSTGRGVELAREIRDIATRIGHWPTFVTDDGSYFPCHTIRKAQKTQAPWPLVLVPLDAYREALETWVQKALRPACVRRHE